jgi:hypothetical protein
MLIRFSNLNKYGHLRSRIIYLEGTQFTYKPKGLGKFIAAQPFKYEYEGLLPPGLFVTSEGDKYIVPIWKKVHPQTTKDDIIWTKPSYIIPTKEVKQWEFKSSSSDQIYKVTQNDNNELKCNCMGFFRSRGNCKHVKEVKQKLND